MLCKREFSWILFQIMSGYNLREQVKRKKALDYETPFLRAKSKRPQLKSVNHRPRGQAKRSSQPPPAIPLPTQAVPLVTPAASTSAATSRPPSATTSTATMASADEKLDRILSNFQRFETRMNNVENRLEE